MRSILLAMFAAIPLAAAASIADRPRTLVVFAPVAGSPELATQDGMLSTDRAGLRERDIVVVHVVGDRVTEIGQSARALRRRFDVAPGVFAVRLAGRDGHVALRSATPVDTVRLFATIDAMPMRRAEMARHD